ncbi:MAG: ferredoxin [Thermoproteota archaeon]
MAKFEVKIDKRACQGFGACVELCPEYFHLSEVDGKTTIDEAEEVKEGGETVAEIYKTDDLRCIRDGAEACPYNAIHITNTETGEKLI